MYAYQIRYNDTIETKSGFETIDEAFETAMGIVGDRSDIEFRVIDENGNNVTLKEDQKGIE